VAVGVGVAVPKMRVNLAVLSPGRADAVIEGETDVSRWIVGGHSLGGAMACRYAGQRGGRPARIGTDEAHRRVADVFAAWLCRDLGHCPNGNRQHSLPRPGNTGV